MTTNQVGTGSSTYCLLRLSPSRRLISRPATGVSAVMQILPIYKGKGDPMECGSYREIKLLEHAMKVVERIFEHRIWQQIEVDDMQFGFMKGKGTTDAIFTVRQMQENFRVKGKKLYRIYSCISRQFLAQF